MIGAAANLAFLNEQILGVDFGWRLESPLARIVLRDYRRRSPVGFVLMTTQSFLYNAIFFTYALILAPKPSRSSSSSRCRPLCGGMVAPWLFATLIGNGDDRVRVFVGYAIAAALMVFGVHGRRDTDGLVLRRGD
jgi:hypothetical protein